MTKTEPSSAYRSTQILTLIFSLIFFSVVAYGYFNLVVRSGVFLALVVGGLFGAFAWYLARVVGTSPGGIKKNWVLLLPLFVVSSTGVYNTFMLYLEGSSIVSETASDVQAQFGALQRSAEVTLDQKGVTDHLGRVRTSSDALFSEIRNPLACGQGPEAARRVSELKRELPGFVELSNPHGGCDQNEEVISDYKNKIADLTSRAGWNIPDLQSVVSDSALASTSVQNLRQSFAQNYNPFLLKQVLANLENLDDRYRNLRFRLSKYTDVKDLAPNLHISEVQSLGNAFKLPSLFFERLGLFSSYAYLIIAFSFDLLMVYLFERLSNMQVARRSSKVNMAKAW